MEYWTEYQGHIPDIQGKRKKFDNTIYTFDIEINGRYYFFVTNLSETEELYIEATVLK